MRVRACAPAPVVAWVGAVSLVLSHGLSSREESRMMDLNTFMIFKISTSQYTLYNRRGEIELWVVCVLLTPHRLTGGCVEI